MFIRYCYAVIYRLIFATLTAISGCFTGTNLRKREAGDVPGWVMITLMTAGLVVLLWSVVGPALVSLFQSAIERLSSIS